MNVDSIAKLLAMGLLVLAALEAAIWLPSYLAAPWYADHDVFATMAHGWNYGLLPYRELVGNNFPGTIYFFWIVGRLAGWGNVLAYNAFDATLLAALFATTVVWSRLRFGRLLPGAVSIFALASYYFGLDFSMVAQRDWHAALFVALAMMVIEIVPGMAGLVLSASLTAIGLSVRPQVLMFLPGLIYGTWVNRADSSTWAVGLRQSSFWMLCLAASVSMLFYPLIRNGLTRDLYLGLSSVLPGSSYSRPKGEQLLTIGLRILARGRVWAVFPMMALIWVRSSPHARRSSIGWSLLLVGATLYLAVTPILRHDVMHAFWLIWCYLMGVLIAMVLEEANSSGWSLSPYLLIMLTFAMLLDVGHFPSGCRPASVKPSIAAIASRRPTTKAPWFYRTSYEGMELPPWVDYQAALKYLKTQLPPTTRVANALIGVAINGPAARFSAFPAESATWLAIVRPGDEQSFIDRLKAEGDSVVVWNPEPTGVNSVGKHLPRLAQAIRDLYEPSVKFGQISIWRRK